MKEKLKVFAPYISLFGLLTLASTPVVLWLIQQNGGTPPTWLGWTLAGVGLVLLLAWPLLSPDEVRHVLGKRQARYGGNALVLILAVIGILIAVNFLSSRRYWTWDLTANQQFTISRQSVQILEDLQQPVVLTAVLGAADQQAGDDLDRLVERYRQRSDQLSYQRIDPQVDAEAVMGLSQRLEQQPPGRALIAESGGKHAIVYAFDEQSVTEAIVKATRAEDRTVAFTTGHGEHDPNGGSTDGRGYGGVKQQLEREGYTVTTQNLTALTDTLKADAVIVAGPQRPFLPEEAKILSDFVTGGGSVLLMLDSGEESGLESVLAPWGIKPQGDIVLQPASILGPAAVIAAGENYQFHTITKDLSSLMSALVGTQSFEVGQPVTTTLQTTTLIEVGTAGAGDVWGETDLAGLGENPPRAEPGPTDIQAPLALAVAAEGGEDSGRLAVFGTSSLASDRALQQLQGVAANFDLFLNTINWLTADEELISIRPTEPDQRAITPPARPYLLLFVLAVLIPLAIFGIGFWLYWRRR